MTLPYQPAFERAIVVARWLRTRVVAVTVAVTSAITVTVAVTVNGQLDVN